MSGNNDIFGRYKNHLAKIEEELARLLSSRVALVEDMGKHALLAQGKRLRPLIFILSSQLSKYEGRDLHHFATIFEYIHTASLLHDDVLDNAEIRRRKPAANQLWGNHAAILEGDFLYAKASSVALEAHNPAFLKAIVDTVVRMSEGQILEIKHTHDWETSKDVYMEIITAKTAVLIAAACSCGAILSGADEKSKNMLELFGLNMGIAFQLIDDLLDYTSSEDVFGKPVGKDLREGKVTLPLIYTLSNLEASERKGLEDLFKYHQPTDDDYMHVIELVRSNGALERIRYEAKSLGEKAEGFLSGFADSPVKKDLLALNRSMIERTY